MEWRNITVVLCQNTFLVKSFIKSCHAIGGGRACMEILLLIVGPAHSAPFLTLVEKSTKPYYTQYQLNESSK